MNRPGFDSLSARISEIATGFPVGRIAALDEAMLRVSGLSGAASLGDLVEICPPSHPPVLGEVVRIDGSGLAVLPGGPMVGIGLNDRVILRGPPRLAPHHSWIGRLIDPFGRPLDGRPLLPGAMTRDPKSPPPPVGRRRPMGERVEAGLAAFNTVLPIVRGQRIGLFSGSGVGKSTLLAGLARNLDADVTVIALIGERGREVGHFVETVLGKQGMARSVVVAATSDTSPLHRRRCAASAMSIAEHFRDEGKHVLLLADSLTRFAEAHRDVALAAGEAPALAGFPPSLTHQLMGLAERAGPGAGAAGDITAVFSVLVAGSDMDGPVADTLRGVLDGHVVLDRRIAERGRFPAIDLLRSVSRALPEAASEQENGMIADARRLLGAYDRAELMIQSGLYTQGNDPMIDRAVRCWPKLDSFLSRTEPETIAESFKALDDCLQEV